MDWFKLTQKKIVKGILFLGLMGITNLFSQNPIVFSLYTLHENILKINTQIDPALGNANQPGILEILVGNTWTEVDRSNVINPGWTIPFRVENWDMTIDVSYRIRHLTGEWTGVIRKDPVDKDTIVVAAFTGNSVNSSHGGTTSKQDIVDNVKRQAPDLLAFTGDQVYNHTQHLTYWVQFGRDFGELMRDIPAVSIPDDHDAGQANLWGSSGKQITNCNGTAGGYCRSAAYVQEVERAQTSNLPDPYDPTPIQRNIGVYYTDLTVGGVSFAVIEDRKFKTGPQEILSAMPGPRWDHVTDPTFDVASIDVPQAVLYGQRQLDFIDAWAQDWKGTEMKATITATNLANLAHLHGGSGNRLIADLDANGWPQTGRNKALRAIRKAFAFMITGDQHLSTVAHHGVDDWGDAGWSFCVPSIANLYLRYWLPVEEGQNRQPGMPDYRNITFSGGVSSSTYITGDFLDGLKNKVTIWAVSNPINTGRTPTSLHNRAPGYGIIKFDKKNRKITMESWPRYVDPRTGSPYLGWPLTIDQEQNYGRAAVENLPTLEVSGMTDPVVQVINEKTGEIEYTLRIKGNTYTPKVFENGNYTIKVGEIGDTPETVLTGIPSIPVNQRDTLRFVVGQLPIKKEKFKIDPNAKVKIGLIKNANHVSINIPNRNSYLVDIIDVKGAIHISRTVQGPGKYAMSIYDMTPGVYTIKAKSGKETVTQKIKVLK